MLAALVTLVFSIKRYGPMLLQYKEARDLYDRIEDDNVSEPESEDKNRLIEWMASLGIDSTLKVSAYIDVESDALYKQNNDYLGWIYIPDTRISYPVVISHDNIDYLHMSFDKGYLYAGTIFMDCRCYDGITNKHSVIYGHNMNDGSMFAGIRSYSSKEFLEEHPVFWFITPEYKLLYQIFSATESSPYDEIIYGVTYKHKNDFAEQMNQIAHMSLVETGIVPEPEDFVMTLSTCTGNSATRFAVHGILLGALSSELK